MTSALPSPAPVRPVPALPSSTVLLMSDRTGALQVLMVRRAQTAVFGGLFVFPGGIVDPIDHSPLATRALGNRSQGAAWRAAGLRETAEEVGIYLTDRPIPTPGRSLVGAEVYRWVLRHGARFDAGRLRYLSNWVTPRAAPQRYDARFYLARVAGDEGLLLAETELTEWVWTSPARALDRFRRGKWQMILPTVKTLEYLQEFHNSAEAWESVDETRQVEPVLPRLVVRAGKVDALLPGDAGYEEAE